jgi:transcriptional regulator with XRE-family HTH domain
MNNLVYKIKKFRVSKGYSQEDISKKLNISQSAYAKIENGITKLDIDRLFDISKILEIDIADLLNVEEAKTVNYKKANQSPAFVENYNVGIKDAYDETIKNLRDEIMFYRRLLEAMGVPGEKKV